MMFTHNIKLWVCVACLASSLAAPAPAQQPELYLDIIDMAAISRMSPQQLEVLAEGLAAEEIMRTKRSSAQALTSVASKASSGIQSKVGLLGQASSFIASASSKTGGHGDEHSGYTYEAPQQGEKYDYWGLKKSILYTLFQAVKAITGGVTILKGQLIKGGGALAATLGKVISVKGDAVSSLGKKIVSSAALSEKKPHASHVYGPPPTANVEYGPPTAYGAPTAQAFSSPSIPTGFASHKYPAQLDGPYGLVPHQRKPPHSHRLGRGKLGGVQAGLVFLAPLGNVASSETMQTAHSSYTPLEPPPSILHTVYSAIKNAFTPTAATAPAAPAPPAEEPSSYLPPPPPQPVQSYMPMAWGTVNSYGEPAAPYDYPPYQYGAPTPGKHAMSPSIHKRGLTPDKIQKISNNLNKITAYLHKQQRSLGSDVDISGVDEYREMLKKANEQFLPTPLTEDENEVGVLPGEMLSDPIPSISTISSIPTISSTTSTTTTMESPKTTTDSNQNRRKDLKYYLRGNKIVQG